MAQIFLLGATALALDASAATKTWTGAAGTNWTAGASWEGGSAPSSRDRLVFDGATLNTTVYNDFPEGRRFTLALLSGGYDLTGNQIRLNNYGTNDLFQVAGVTNAIGLDLLLGGNRDFTILENGVLVVDGQISGNGRDLRKRGGGTLTLTSGENSFGRLDIYGGTVQVSLPGALGSDDVTLGAGGADVTFEYLGEAGTIANEFRLGSNDRSASQIGAGIIRNSGAGTLTFSAANFNQTRTRARADRTVKFDGTGDIVVAGRIRGNSSAASISLIKSGVNTLTLSGVNTYKGSTTVLGGFLMINGSLDDASVVSVWSGGGLGGGGVVGGSVTINANGQLAPGNGVGSLETGSLNLLDASTLVMDLDSDAVLSSAVDLVLIEGDLFLSGEVGLLLSDMGSAGVAEDTVFSLVNYSGAWNGGLFTVDGDEVADGETFSAAGMVWEIDYDVAVGGVNFSNEYLGGGSSHITIKAIPEPTVMVLVVVFGGGILLLKRVFD